MQVDQEVLGILTEVLSLDDRSASMDRKSPLLGAVPELDSMSVVTVLMTLEERFGLTIGVDELNASTFQTVGTLADFVSKKLAS